MKIILKVRFQSLAVIAICFYLMATLLMIPADGLAGPNDAEQVIKITAKRYEYNPNKIFVKVGKPVVLEFTSLDRLHGFDCPGLAIRTDIPPGITTTLRFVAEKAGEFSFHCNIFCGEGHEGMTGTIIVEE